MKYSTKQISTVVISIVIMLMMFAIFVLLFNESQKDKVSYIYDDVNTCVWEQGVITSATEAFDMDLETVEINADEEERYLEDASENGDCIARMGDTAGFYALQLNEQYRQQ